MSEAKIRGMCDGHWCSPGFCICPIPDQEASNGAPELSPLELAAIEDTLKIAKLEAQLAVALPMIEEQNAMLAIAADVVVTARAFVEVVTAQTVKTGEAVFKTVHGLEDSDPIVQTLNYRFSDLAAALNSAGRPVPPKLAQGTVH